MKISDLVESIFSHAVALDQSGGLRNTIYALQNEIYILNYDYTVLLRFTLRRSETPFESPISFQANDYDSNVFYEKNGKIIFENKKAGFLRKKSCGQTDLSPEEVCKIFNKYPNMNGDSVILPKEILGLLEKELSHIEFCGQTGDVLKITQRNIYSGALIEVRQVPQKLLQETLTHDFGPIAIKTNDFFAMYSFQDNLKFTFPKGKEGDYIIVRSIDRGKRDMQGIIACCIYDEIIKIRRIQNGGKEQKIRRGK
ncbi:MAG: hypothetical protein ACTSXY_02570 [Promethearchaeota archaeon]